MKQRLWRRYDSKASRCYEANCICISIQANAAEDMKTCWHSLHAHKVYASKYYFIMHNVRNIYARINAVVLMYQAQGMLLHVLLLLYKFSSSRRPAVICFLSDYHFGNAVRGWQRTVLILPNNMYNFCWNKGGVPKGVYTYSDFNLMWRMGKCTRTTLN